jgi:hypothetical protein
LLGVATTWMPESAHFGVAVLVLETLGDGLGDVETDGVGDGDVPLVEGEAPGLDPGEPFEPPLPLTAPHAQEAISRASTTRATSRIRRTQ